MIKKFTACILTVLISGCANRPVDAPLNIKPFENQKTYDLPTNKVIDELGPKLDSYLKSTSATSPKIEVRNVSDEFRDNKKRFLILATDYSPKDSKLTVCRGGRFWGDGDNGLDHGVLGVILTAVNQSTTMVEVKTAFIENNNIEVRGKAIGYVRTPSGYTATVHKNENVDVGSHCYSTGEIEQTILGFIKHNPVAAENQQYRVEDRYAADINAYRNKINYLIKEHNEAEIRQFATNLVTLEFPPMDDELKEMNVLGVVFASGIHVKKDDAFAFKLFSKAVFTKNGQIRPESMDAVYNLGMMHESGRGTAKNTAKALEFYQTSAKAGVDLAQLKLGYLYANGLLGLNKDERKAAALFTKVAQRELSLVAFYNLGLMYSQGLGVRKNEELAYICYKVLAQTGEGKAQASADAIGKNLTKVQLARAQDYLQSDKYKRYLESGLSQ